MRLLVAFAVGLIFALGLGISGMTQTHVVRGFLDVFGSWNPALIGVMVGAISTHAILYRLILRRESPLLDSKFHLPTKKEVDRRLLLGAAIFGLGWGWAGICPGPGLVGLLGGDPRFLWFVGSMLVGMGLFKLWEKNP